MTIILVTGFGPFPGAPFNPTTPLVHHLARLRRPALTGITIVTHIFSTAYAAVDKELPALIARHKPDALLMFGLATRTKKIRIELRARNILSSLPDSTARVLGRRAIAPGASAILVMPAPVRQLLAAVRTARLPLQLSQDAGSYLCNYLCWHAADAVHGRRGPRLAAFVHVPLVHRHGRRARGYRFAMGDLKRAGEALLMALVRAARR
jgi:pyroglutamyl-peptidase